MECNETAPEQAGYLRIERGKLTLIQILPMSSTTASNLCHMLEVHCCRFAWVGSFLVRDLYTNAVAALAGVSVAREKSIHNEREEASKLDGENRHRKSPLVPISLASDVMSKQALTLRYTSSLRSATSDSTRDGSTPRL